MADDESLNLEQPARELTRGFLEGIRDWLLGWKRGATPSTPARGILILGPGGTGKTTFARFLSAEPYWLFENPGEYTESLDLERFTLSDDSDVEVVVAPGQDFRRPSTWPELLKQVVAGEYRGVVLMNAYGYHTFSTPSYQHHQLYQGSKSDFLQAYYADRLVDELRVLRQLVPHLSVCGKRVWLLSVVAKQDLWCKQQREVEEHYRRGEYSVEIEKVAQALGPLSFRHEIVFLSLIIRSLRTSEGETLQENQAGYDMTRLAASLGDLLTKINGLRTWEERT